MSTYTLRFDGGSRGNPGTAGSAAVILKNNTILDYCYYYHPEPRTNNYAEYYGLIIGMKLVISHGIKNIHIEGDSKLILQQVFGKFKCNSENLQGLNSISKKLKEYFQDITWNWIAREYNKSADMYCNQAMDKKECYGDYNLFDFEIIKMLPPPSSSKKIEEPKKELIKKIKKELKALSENDLIKIQKFIEDCDTNLL